MSRLDSFIRRITAQRDCLNFVAEMIEGCSGVVLELGLGNGRTYDHMRELFPDRDIFVFERTVAAHPECVPDERHMIVGDIRQTLPLALPRPEGEVVFAHADLGSGNPEVDDALAAFVAQTLPAYLARDGVVLSDQDLSAGDWSEVPLPPGIRPGRYFIYQAR